MPEKSPRLISSRSQMLQWSEPPCLVKIVSIIGRDYLLLRQPKAGEIIGTPQIEHAIRFRMEGEKNFWLFGNALKCASSGRPQNVLTFEKAGDRVGGGVQKPKPVFDTAQALRQIVRWIETATEPSRAFSRIPTPKILEWNDPVDGTFELRCRQILEDSFQYLLIPRKH